MLNFRARPRRKGDPSDITGSVPTAEEGEPPKPAAPATEPPSPTASWCIPTQTPQVSESERAILERLQARRQELEPAPARSKSARAC